MPSPAGAPAELREIRHSHLFCGLGAGARGFNRGTARVGNMQAVFRCLGGIDVSSAAIRDFGRLAGVPGTVLDPFDADQYAAFHGSAPPPGWRAATAQDVQAAAGHLDSGQVGLNQGPMPDQIRLDDWKRKQALEQRFGKRPSSRHGNCPNWSVG